jgi:4-amino-4-deoxy-L-arabinose transferase-like glycosyltransferase
MKKKKGKKIVVNSWDIIFLLFLLIVANTYLNNAKLHDFWPDEGVMGWEAYKLLNANFNFAEVNLVHPPLMQGLMALFFKLWGVSDVVARNVVPLFAVLGIASIYALGTLMYDRKAGFIAALLLTTSWVYGFYGIRLLTDAVAASTTIFAFATFYYAITRKTKFSWGLLSFGTFLAIFSKETGWVVPFAYLFYAFFLFIYEGYKKNNFNLKILDQKSLSWIKKKEFWIALFIPFLILSPWIVKNISWVMYEFQLFDWEYAGYSIEKNPDLFFYITNLPRYIILPDEIGSFMYLVSFLFILSSLGLAFYSDPKKAALLLVQPLILIGILTFWSYKDFRYILPVYPFFYIFLGSFFYNLKSIVKNIDRYFILFFVIILLFANSTLNYQRAFIYNKALGYYGYKQAAEFLNPLLSPNEKIIASSWSQMRFYLLRDGLIAPPTNETELERIIQKEGIRYIEADPYEWSQPEYFIPYLSSHPERFKLVHSALHPTSVAEGRPVGTFVLEVIPKQ